MTELPSGWARPRLEDVLAPLEDGRVIHQGWSPQCHKEASEDDVVWGVLKTTAIQAGAFLPEHNKQLPDNLEPRPLLEVSAGDVLITSAGPRARCGIACLVRETRPRLMMSGKMYRFRFDDRFIDPRFVEAYLLGDLAIGAIDQMKTGGSDSGLNLTHSRFRQLPIPLAPRAEQERIVNAIDEAFSKLDAGESGLQTVRRRLKRMRDAVLADAVSGRLVPQDPADTPAAKLLADLGSVPRLATPDLPAGWSHATVGDLLDRIEAGKSFATDGRPAGDHELGVIKVSAMTWGEFRPHESKALPANAAVDPRWIVSAHDLLFSRANTSEYVGACVLVQSAFPFRVLSDKSLRLVPHGGIDRRWLLYALRSRPARAQIEVLATGTKQSMRNISQEKLRRISVALPPPEEQLRIAMEVERQLSFVDACERVVDAGLARSAALRRSVLKSAFEGKLVAEDPADEAASVLLERLRAESDATDALQGSARQRPSTVGKR